MMTQGYVLICISMKVILFGLVTLTIANVRTYALMIPTSTMAASPLMFSLADSIGMMPSNMPHNDDVAVV